MLPIFGFLKKQKIISRRRVYLLAESPLKGAVADCLRESEEGTWNGLKETLLKGTQNGLKELTRNNKCAKCNKNIDKKLLINIRKFGNSNKRISMKTCC